MSVLPTVFLLAGLPAGPLAAVPEVRPVPIVLEAAAGRLVGVATATARPGYSGAGYVTGFEDDGDRVEFEFDAAAGLYAATLRHALPSGEKGYHLAINDERRSGMLRGSREGWHDHAAGLVRLRAGRNRIAVGKGWGWWDFDRLTLTPASLPAFEKPPVRLSDPRVDPAATALLRRLIGLYGERTLAGQMDQRDIDYCRSVTGTAPALGGFDLMDCSPSRVAHGAQGEGVVDEAIAWGRRGGIVMLMWHWNAPTDLVDTPGGKEWWRGFYTEATTFDLAAALADPAGERYRLLVRDLDAIAPVL
ncbi:MAG: glycosyl hydrolase, partial [bacterium]